MIARRDIDLAGALLALLVSFFWGANPVAIKLGLEDAPPLRLAWMRFVVGGGVVALWAWATGRLANVRLPRAEWRPLIVLGLLFAAQIGTMNIGTSLTSAAHSAILLNLYAVHTVVLSHFLIPGDRLSGSDTLAGDALMFVSAFLLAERTMYLARAVQRLDPVKLILSQAAIGCVIFLAASLATEAAPTRWTPRLAAAVAYQGVLIAGFNFVINLWLLRRYRPSSLAAYFLTQPLFGVVIAALVTGDRLTVDLLIASLAVAVGIGLTSR